MPRAHAVVWLDLPRWRCLLGVLWRVARNYGRVRPDIAPGCPERFDGSFMRFIWDYPRDKRPKTARMLERLGARQRVFVLRSHGEILALEAELASIRREAA